MIPLSQLCLGLMSQDKQRQHLSTLFVSSKMLHALVYTDMNTFHMHTRHVVTRYTMQLFDRVLRCWITSLDDLLLPEDDAKEVLSVSMLRVSIGLIL